MAMEKLQAALDKARTSRTSPAEQPHISTTSRMTQGQRQEPKAGPHPAG